MKDEIKEMCHKCKKYPAEYNQTYCEFCLGISDKDDYITNLQEKNKELKKKITFNEKSRRKMQQSLVGQIEDYKSRNDKAIQYIEKGNKHFKENYNEPYEYAFMVNADEIMKILKGKSDE